MSFRAAVLIACLGLAPAAAHAATIGKQVPAAPLSQAMIDAGAPADSRPAWSAYLQRSQELMAADKAALATEREGLASTPEPPAAAGAAAGMPLDRDAAWYGAVEARRIAANIISFQTPAGGWGKNQDRAGPPREPGQTFVGAAEAESWSYVGTFDNGSTCSELAFLARVQAALPGAEGEAYRAAFLKGARYILTAQYPNGGWPQVYPLMGEYHDALTYNDDGFGHLVALMADVGARRGDYGFVPQELAAQAQASAAKGLDVLLKSQVVVGGKKTVWGQQHDPITLRPVGARNYEMASLAAAESAGLLVFLMQQEPTPQIREAVHAGVAWLKANEIHGFEWTDKKDGAGRMLHAKEGAGPLWSRFYDIETSKPIFGERDQSIFDTVADVGAGRRNGYSWYNSTPKKALELYETWKVKNPA